MTNLDTVIKEHLIEIGDSNFSRYARTMQFAISTLRELNMDVSGTITSAELPITDRDTVNYPPDYINYVRIGVCCGDEIIALGLNENKCLAPKKDNCGDDIQKKRDGDSWGGFFMGWDGIADHYKNGENVGRFFGLGGGNSPVGTYTPDDTNREFHISCNRERTHIVLEYIADIKTIDGHFQVHPFIIETLKAGIYYRSLQRNSSKNIGEKQLAKNDYDLAYRNSKKRFMSSTFDEWKAAFRKGNKLSPRY